MKARITSLMFLTFGCFMLTAQVTSADPFTRPLSAPQSFIITDDAPAGETVGHVKAYPEFEMVGDLPTFSLGGGDTERFEVTGDGILSYTGSGDLSDDTYEVGINIAKNGFEDTHITLLIEVLDAGDCIFIDPSAGSNGSGTRGSPFNVLPAFESNKNFLLKRGSTIVNNQTKWILGLENVLVGAYGEGALPKFRSNGGGITISDFSDNITIRELDFATHEPAGDGSNWGPAIYASSGKWSNVYVLHCEIHHVSQAVLLISWSPNPNARNSTTEWNHIYEILSDGIFLSYTDGLTRVNNNKIELVNRNWDFVGTTEQEAPGDGIQVGFCENTEINHNYVDRSTTGNKFCIILGDGIYADVNDNYLITPHAIGSGIYWISYNGKCRRNTIMSLEDDAPGNGVWVHSGSPAVTHNLFLDLNSAGVQNQGGVDVEVYNNLFYRCDYAIASGNDITARNNIYFVEAGDRVYDNWNPVNSDYNLFNDQVENMFGPGVTMVQSQRPDREVNSIIGAPQFFDPANLDFRIPPESPLIAAGTDMGVIVDFNLQRNTLTPNIGPFEVNNPNDPRPVGTVMRETPENKFYISPNPVQGGTAVLLRSEREDAVDIRVEIFSQNGSLLHRSDNIHFLHQHVFELDYVPSGALHFRVSSDDAHSESHTLLVR